MKSIFDYKITAKNGVEVISLSGRLTKDTKDKLESCRQEIISSQSDIFIIYFKDVPAVDPAIFRELSLLQQDIRKKRVQLFLVGLDNDLKNYLVERGIIRMSEIRKTLEESLKKM